MDGAGRREDDEEPEEETRLDDDSSRSDSAIPFPNDDESPPRRRRGEEEEIGGGPPKRRRVVADASEDPLTSRRDKAAQLVGLVQELGGNVCAHTTPLERKILRNATCPPESVLPRHAYADPPHAVVTTFVLALLAGILLSEVGRKGQGRVYGRVTSVLPSVLPILPSHHTIDRLLTSIRR